MFRQSVPLALIAGLVLPISLAARQGKTDSPNSILKGRGICIDASNKESDCSTAGRRFAFKSTDGSIYTHNPNDPMRDVFADTRMRERDLKLTVRIHKGNTIDIIKVQSIRDGKLHDVYYFCDVCTITSYAMGPCPCCGKDMEFVETPANNPDFQTEIHLERF